MKQGVSLNKNIKKAANGDSSAPYPQALVYHTFFAEFRGTTHADIVHALHEDSRTGTGMEFDQWWSYQKKAFGGLVTFGFPKSTDEDGAEKLVNILVKAGALDVGPKKPSTPQLGMHHG